MAFRPLPEKHKANIGTLDSKLKLRNFDTVS
jgi:hypothetical protein